jgi:hypothetical protein
MDARDVCHALFSEHTVRVALRLRPLLWACNSAEHRWRRTAFLRWRRHVVATRIAHAHQLRLCRNAFRGFRDAQRSRRRYAIMSAVVAHVVYRGLVRPRFLLWRRGCRAARRRELLGAAALLLRRRRLRACVKAWIRFTFLHHFYNTLLSRMFVVLEQRALRCCLRRWRIRVLHFRAATRRALATWRNHAAMWRCMKRAARNLQLFHQRAAMGRWCRVTRMARLLAGLVRVWQLTALRRTVQQWRAWQRPPQPAVVMPRSPSPPPRRSPTPTRTPPRRRSRSARRRQCRGHMDRSGGTQPRRPLVKEVPGGKFGCALRVRRVGAVEAAPATRAMSDLRRSVTMEHMAQQLRAAKEALASHVQHTPR